MTLSPCVRVCRLTPTGICEGCRRTVDEIAAWPRMTEDERREIMERLRDR